MSLLDEVTCYLDVVVSGIVVVGVAVAVVRVSVVVSSLSDTVVVSS